MKSQYLYLIRHGETAWNAENKLNSYTDTKLSNKGFRQVEALAKSFQQIPIEHAFSSPLMRASQTAKILIGEKSIEIKADSDLTEVSFGVFEGESSEKMEDPKTAGIFKNWRDGEMLDEKYGLEPFSSVAQRSKSFLRKINNLEGGILIVSHGYLIRVLIATCVLGLEPHQFQKVWLSNASCSLVIRQPGGADQIRFLNAINFSYVDVFG